MFLHDNKSKKDTRKVETLKKYINNKIELENGSIIEIPESNEVIRGKQSKCIEWYIKD